MFSFRAVPYGQMYYRELEKCKVQSLARSGGNCDSKAYISEEAANELEWWIRNISGAFAPIKLLPFNFTIFLTQVWKAGEAHIKWQKLEVDGILWKINAT